MSSDPGMLPPVPAGYGSLDGGPPGADVGPGGFRRRVKPFGRVATAGAAQLAVPSTDRDALAFQQPAPTGEVPVIEDRGFTERPDGPMIMPDGPGPIAPMGPPRPRLFDREGRRQERAEQWPDGAEEYLPGGRFRRERVRVVRGRRSRRIIRRIDTWTVLKVSLVFYLCVLIVVLISGVVLWNVAQAFNFTHDIEKSVKTLFGYNTFTLHPTPMFEYTAMGGRS